MVEKYGPANGFGWQLNEVIGAQIISVPMAVPLARADRSFTVFVGSLVGVFVAVGLVLNLIGGLPGMVKTHAILDANQWNFRQLFVDGDRAVRARYPNATAANPFLYTTGAVGNPKGAFDHLVINPSMIKPAWGTAADAQIKGEALSFTPAGGRPGREGDDFAEIGRAHV